MLRPLAVDRGEAEADSIVSSCPPERGDGDLVAPYPESFEATGVASAPGIRLARNPSTRREPLARPCPAFLRLPVENQ